MPASVHPATVPADPKSTSSGWAVTSRIRSISSSGSMTANLQVTRRYGAGRMLVDSYLFLPRSFRPLYDGLAPMPGEDQPVWAPFERRLADARIALLTSAGLYVAGEQEPFDGDRERAEPEWGDPTWRTIPAGSTSRPGALGMMHLH